jgi:hypothetical protein
MPAFKTTNEIFYYSDQQDKFENAFNSIELGDDYNFINPKNLPKETHWQYKRDMQISDVLIWEQIAYGSGGIGIYASYLPFAEFYLFTSDTANKITTFYDKNKENNANMMLENFLILNKIHQWGMLPYKINTNIDPLNVVIESDHISGIFFKNKDINEINSALLIEKDLYLSSIR